LADSDGRLHQLRANARLLDILGRLYEEQTLQPKIFLAGFSAGGQFVHGYAFTNPNYVVGVSAIAPGNYYEPSSTSRHIPFLVIVGDGDDPGNVENAKQLAWLLGQAGYSVELHVLEGEGHTVSEEAIEITLDLYDQTVGR
jgi:predicted esterase